MGMSMSDKLGAAARYIAAQHAKDDGPCYWWLSDMKYRFGLGSWENAVKAFGVAEARHGIYYHPNMLAGYVITGLAPVRPSLRGGWELVPANKRHLYLKGHKHEH